MKAVILAAGEGRRLRPLTLSIPKCLLPVRERPLLAHWFDKLQEAGIEEVYVNGHYLASQVEMFIDRVRPQYDFRINFVKEPRLTGTGGFLKKLYAELQMEDFFFFCHGDNFTNIDLVDFIDFHVARKSELTLAMFRSENPAQCGIVETISRNSLITVFREKPAVPKTNLASAAIFLMSPEIIASFPDKEAINFSAEVLPLYQGRMYGYQLDGYNIDIGTPESYNRANALAARNEP